VQSKTQYPSPSGQNHRKSSQQECIFDKKRTPSDCIFGDFVPWAPCPVLNVILCVTHLGSTR